MKKQYELKKYYEIIEYINYYININDITINKISKYSQVSRRTLRRILNFQIKRTNFNPISLLESIFKLQEETSKKEITYIRNLNLSENKMVDLEREFPELSSKDRRFIKIILYFLYFLKEIENYEDFFTDLFYLIDSQKKKRFDFVIQLLLDNKILELKANNIIKQGKNYFISSLKHRTKIYNFNVAANYFEKKDRFKEAFVCYRFLGNNRKREANLMEHISDIYFSNTPQLCLELFNTYFTWLKKNSRRKSNEFKIFYLSVIINYFSNRSMLSNAFMYSLYLIKYIRIKEHILSIECNKNFSFQSVYELDTIAQCKYKTVSHFVNSALLRFVTMYFNFSMYSYAFKLNRAILSKLPEKDVHYPYFSNLEFMFIYKFGDLKRLKTLISNLEKIDCLYERNSLFKMNQLYYSLSSDVLKIKELHKEFLQNFNPENYHYYYINNIYEQYIIYLISQNHFKKSIVFCFSFMFYKKKTNIYESLLYFLLIFIQLVKHHQKSLFSMQLKNVYKTLFQDPFRIVFQIPEKDNLSDQITSFFLIGKKNASSFEELTIKEFYLILFIKAKNTFAYLKKEFSEKQILFLKKKKGLVNKMRNQLIQDEYLKNDSNRKQDIIATFINRYPEDNNILTIFTHEESDEDIFSHSTFIQEFNFFEHFLDKMLKEFSLFENKQITKKIDKISFFENISENLITQMFDSKFDFNTYISMYFENYLKKLENERKMILKTIENDESNKKINLTKKLLSIFDNDVDEKFLQFTKAYILAKY